MITTFKGLGKLMKEQIPDGYSPRWNKLMEVEKYVTDLINKKN